MSKSISPMLFLMPEAKPFRASPRSHRSDEFAVGYSLAVCSPALPASASPAGIHLQTAGSYLSTVSFGKISKLDSKVRTRQNINVRGGPNQSIEVGQTGVSNSRVNTKTIFIGELGPNPPHSRFSQTSPHELHWLGWVRHRGCKE